MKAQCLLSDLISSLPSNLIETILVLLPIRDAFRTSILSRKWRYQCLKIPKLVFDDHSLQGSKYNQSSTYKLSQVVFQVLSLHHGPVLEFSLCFFEVPSFREIDPIIFHLARNNTVEKFTLEFHCSCIYKLPSSFFSLKRLKHLKLCSCEFLPPWSFCDFSRLTCLDFDTVRITTKILIRLLSSCSQLKSFTLLAEEDIYFTGKGESNLIELFDHLREVEYLHMDFFSIKDFADVGLPRKLSTLAHLKTLNLSLISLMEQHELSLVLLLIRSSPNLQKLYIWLNGYAVGKYAVEKKAEDIIGLSETQDVRLEHLKEFKVKSFMNLDPELEFVKLILAKALKLNILLIRVSEVSKEEEVDMLTDLISLPRASPTAKIIWKECKEDGESLT